MYLSKLYKWLLFGPKINKYIMIYIEICLMRINNHYSFYGFYAILGNLVNAGKTPSKDESFEY